jgi:polyhydroxyalkanoate synthase
MQGFRNYLDDLVENQGMPSQVDKSQFKVGGNMAATPGSVVFRNPLVELIQYRPTTESVLERPCFIVPPQINKYYIYDMSPAKSFVAHAVAQGLQVFIVSWRNPRREHRKWGLDDYVAAIEEAIDATLEITGQETVNGIGACAGGITFAAALGHLAAVGKEKVSSITLMVNVLVNDPGDSVMGLFANDVTIEAARRRSARAGILDGKSTARVFNWMRPNDLIWNYVVNNYLHGEKPPVFDILYWNNDTTNLPAKLHSDFLDIFKSNPFRERGKLVVRGEPIALKDVTCDAYITGGTTDHITPWQACYRSTQLFGGPVTYVLSTAGHIQSIVNPPDGGKRKYFLNPELPPDPDQWVGAATQHDGSWWVHWYDWVKARAGETVPRPAALGSERHPPLCDAPGTYVHE